MPRKPKPYQYVPERDGVTQGALSSWLRCRQMAYWAQIEGLSIRAPSMGLTYGTISHTVLEHCYAAMRAKKDPLKGLKAYLRKAEQGWRKENPRASAIALEQLEQSMMYAEVVIPFYLSQWTEDRECLWLEPESKFEIPLTMPDDSVIPVRGRIDGAFRYKPKGLVWLLETKHLSRINESTLVDKLPFDLQTQIYVWALQQLLGTQVGGFVYNISRRPQLRQGAKEDILSFRKRLEADIADRMSFYFMRFELAITPDETEQIEVDLRELVWEYVQWVRGERPTYRNSWNCENKYGRCPYLSKCLGEDSGTYYQRTTVYRELEDD